MKGDDIMLENIKKGFGYGIGYILGAAVVASIAGCITKAANKQNDTEKKSYEE